MVLTTIFEPGDTIYYPNIYDSTGKPMEVKDNFIGNSNGKPYVQYLSADLMDRMVEEMHENVSNHYDNLVVVTGPEGVGKSSCAWHICKKFDPEFNIKEGYVYDIGPWLEKLDKGEVKGKVFWFDEATNIASNRDWMKDMNKALIQLLEMLRSYNMTMVMCIPLLSRLDVYIRETRMRYLINCSERSWDFDTERKRGYFEEKRWPTFKTVCWGTFPPIPKDESEIYEEIKRKSQKEKTHEIKERFDESNGSSPKMQKLADNNRKLAWILIRDGYSYQEIEEETGIPQGTIRRWIHEMKGAAEE